MNCVHCVFLTNGEKGMDIAIEFQQVERQELHNARLNVCIDVCIDFESYETKKIDFQTKKCS